MAIRNPRERGARRPSQRRVGVEFKDYDGIDLESDPGSVDKSHFQHLENIDFSLGMKVRGGAQLVNEDTFEGCHQFLSNFDPFTHRLYLAFIGLPNGGGTGRCLAWFDPTVSDSIQQMLYFPWAEHDLVLGDFDGSFHLGVDSYVKRLHLVPPVEGEDPLGTSGKTLDTVIATLLGYTVTALCKFDSKLFIAVENIAAPTNSAIYTWDGKTLDLDVTGIAAPTKMFAFRDKLIVGYAAGEDLLQERDLAGVYTDITHAGTIATVDMASLGDILFIADGGENIWSYDGTTLGVYRTITGAEINGLDPFLGWLYYCYTSVGGHGIVGRAWTQQDIFFDTYHDLFADDPAATQASLITDYRVRQYVVSALTNITAMRVF